MTKITDAYEFKPASGSAPQQIVLLLHGVGSNGQDLIGLAPELSKSLPDCVFVSPDAPFPYDMAPGYPDMYQWFSLAGRTPELLLKGAKMAAPILHEFIAANLKKYDLPASRLALLGFSQGTMMSLYAGPRYPERLAGIMGYSGALIGAQDEEPKIVHRLPVSLIHGESDDVVPVTAYHEARRTLEGMGFPVSGHTTPGLSHGIDRKGIDAGAAFLKSVF